METRRLGRTGHESTVVTFGGYAAGVLAQADADRLIETALARGVNHIDVAPSYADAELRIGDYLRRHPQPHVFIGCKTQKRCRAEAREELVRTIERLGRDQLDLYQLHAVCTMSDLHECFAPGGSMEAFLEGYDEGLIANIGITGHGWQSPATHLAALDRYPFATVMTSANLFMVQNDDFRRDWDALLDRCATDDLGIQLLKATARIAWGDRPHAYGTWYEPFTKKTDVERAVAWALGQPITTLCSAGDVALFETICDAAERSREIGEAAQLTLLSAPSYGDIFVDA
ncbi:MAG: aldo/keto reductase [Gemmatimonadota bacterium]|nr:aldo/keto reductase [Gemmatimonadota bacterium]